MLGLEDAPVLKRAVVLHAASCLSTCHHATLVGGWPCFSDALSFFAGLSRSQQRPSWALKWAAVPAAADVTALNACLAWLPRTQCPTKHSNVLGARAPRGCGCSIDTLDCMSDPLSPDHHAACPEQACCSIQLVRHALESQVSRQPEQGPCPHSAMALGGTRLSQDAQGSIGCGCDHPEFYQMYCLLQLWAAPPCRLSRARQTYMQHCRSALSLLASWAFCCRPCCLLQAWLGSSTHSWQQQLGVCFLHLLR